ncbi:cytochrome P450 [Suillus clintonianus]|uniref:cytochrome P450 n=1 Tax=Suillus clintonianus TaxID=1904413 RepID=UPI001B868497|nr:cytochrome P450 [Suillus clintonianus]KAG2115467.1 cytochrome P450 [Suillus clintonianus]
MLRLGCSVVMVRPGPHLHAGKAPAFTAAHVKTLYPAFWDKANQLRDVWIRAVQEHASQPIDVIIWSSKATLDVIELAGFGYQFNALSGENDELANAYYVIFTTAASTQNHIRDLDTPAKTICERAISSATNESRPVAGLLTMPHQRRHGTIMAQAHAHLNHIGLELIEVRLQSAIAERNVPRQRDRLTVLVASNLETSGSQHMSTDEILCQISTFLIAGYEITSSTLTWCLYSLAKFPDSQISLRKALRTIPISSPTLDDDIRNLVSRLGCSRDAQSACPMAKPFLDKGGEYRNSIKIRKHDIITMPIQAINKKKDIWGEDAYSFRHVPSCSIVFSLTAHRDRPEPWQNPPERVKEIQGLYSNMLTFLGGSHGCIGFRFALAE